MTSLPGSALRRLRRVAAFVGTSLSPVQWPALAVLGWARDNPSNFAARAFAAVRVRPSALKSDVAINPRDLGQLMSFEEIFVEKVYQLDLVPFRPTVIFDCGAHVGCFSVLAASAYPRVPLRAFEPNPDNLPWLRQNVHAYADRATIHAVAVSVKNGTGHLAASASNAGHLQHGEREGVPVAVVDLADLIPREPDSALLIKIDIEGEERRLLPHLLPALPQRCAIYLETHDGVAAREQLIDELVRYRFQVQCLRERAQFADLFAVRAVG